jgi:hypothetical protein
MRYGAFWIICFGAKVSTCPHPVPASDVVSLRSNDAHCGHLRRDFLAMEFFSHPAWHRTPDTVSTIFESEIGTGGKWLFARAAPKGLT